MTVLIVAKRDRHAFEMLPGPRVAERTFARSASTASPSGTRRGQLGVACSP